MSVGSSSPDVTTVSPDAPALILESIADPPSVGLDRELRITYVNAEAVRLLGIPRERILGEVIWKLLPSAVGSILDEKCHEARALHSPQEFEYFHASANRWFFNRIYPTAEGGLAICSRDITEPKRLEAGLRRQALILDQVHESIIHTDLEGNITRWNRGAEELFGYTAAEIIGRNIGLLYFQEDRDPAVGSTLATLRRDGRLQVETRRRRKSGEACSVRASLSLLRDENGTPYGIMGVCTDTTAQKAAEGALRESEERYHGLADAIPQIEYITGVDGRTTWINEHWQRYSGCSADECLELNWLEWIHADDAPAIMTLWTKCLRTGEPFESEYRLRNVNGEYRWHLGKAVTMLRPDGSVLHWVGTATDVHARKQFQLLQGKAVGSTGARQ